MESDSKEWRLKALTDIWTGDDERENDYLILTGLVGSIRWWFEVLVRGLGGKVCDPTSEVRCPAQKKQPHEFCHHCVVCELFGCTGWARKFRLMVVDENNQVIRSQIRAGQVFTLRFIPLRLILPEEWCLLDATLRLIADYGSMGGKTVFKPSDEPKRENQSHHKDYGLISLEKSPEGLGCSLEKVKAYVRDGKWRMDFDDRAFSWASLQHFWFVKGRYLTRQDPGTSTFNAVVRRNPSKRCKDCGQVHLPGQKCPQTQKYPRRHSDDNPKDPINSWLAGRQQESKKVFSFKYPEEGVRTFGFVKPGLVNFDEMKNRLGQVWLDFDLSTEFIVNEQILEKLFQRQEGV